MTMTPPRLAITKWRLVQDGNLIAQVTVRMDPFGERPVSIGGCALLNDPAEGLWIWLPDKLPKTHLERQPLHRTYCVDMRPGGGRKGMP
jgi:hypothetical protein